MGGILNPALSPKIPVSELGSSEITILSTAGGSKSTLINSDGAEAMAEAFAFGEVGGKDAMTNYAKRVYA